MARQGTKVSKCSIKSFIKTWILKAYQKITYKFYFCCFAINWKKWPPSFSYLHLQLIDFIVLFVAINYCSVVVRKNWNPGENELC